LLLPASWCWHGKRRRAGGGSCARFAHATCTSDRRRLARWRNTRALIAAMGHDVRMAATGDEGLALAQSFSPEIVLCDIGLPGGMDGYAVARAFRRDPVLRQAYLVALSGYGHKQAVEEARDAGFDLHVTKPADARRLESVLNSAPGPRH
jgi:CheY-like chemotaxis protein